MTSPVNKYRYKVTNRLGVLQTAPLGESNFTIEYARENDGKLDYTNTLPTAITFTGAAYTNLLKLEKSIYRCDFITIAVERRCMVAGDGGAMVETWVPWFAGRMSLNAGAWDEDRCTVDIKLDDIKEDACFENNEDTDVNILTVGPRRTVFLNPQNITLEKVTYVKTGTTPDVCNVTTYWGGTGFPDAAGWVYYSFSHSEDTGFTPHVCTNNTKWVREVITLPCGTPSPGVEWILVDDACPSGNQKWARPARLYNCVYTNPDFSQTNQLTTYLCSIVGDATGGNISIDNGMALGDILALYINTFCPGLTFVSNFFQINPDVATTINYVTGQRTKTAYITVYQKSDVKRPGVSGNATKGLFSWGKMFQGLINMFNVRWRIDGTVLRMEHVSYFTKNAGLDITQSRYAPYTASMRRYSYDTNAIPAQEVFTFMEAGQGDFTGVPILYSGGCVTTASRDAIKTYDAEKITTDVELCLGNPDSDSNIVSDDGFVFMGVDFDGTSYYIISESSILGGSTLNNSLAWAQLQRDYYKWDRPLGSGIMNNVLTQFITTAPTKKGVTVVIPLCCGDVFEPDDTIRTVLGVGTVDKATYSFKDETLSVDLLYPADKDLVSNQAPVAHNDTAFTYEDQPISINVLANDSDSDGVITAVQIQVPPTHGTAIVQPDMTVLYVPGAGYTGIDNFIYRVLDDWNEPSNNALVAITVRLPNQPPVARPDSFIAHLNTPITYPAPGVFANDSDDVSFSLDAYDAVSVQGGTVVVNSNGSVNYTPPTGYFGPDSFTYRIIDGAALTSTATVSIDVRSPTNPIANDDSYQTRKNTNLTVSAPGLLFNDTTSVGVLSTVIQTQPTVQGGTVTIGSSGDFVYTPPANFTGLDSFIYTASNGSGNDQATVTIRVVPDVFVKLQMVSNHFSTLTIICSGHSQIGGNQSDAIFRLMFYSDSAGTIPLDVTGFGLVVAGQITGTFFGSPGTYVNPFSQAVSGTQFDLFGGPYEYKLQQLDCSNATVAYKNESVTLTPGLYTIL